MDFFTHLLIGIVLGRLLFKDPNKQRALALGSILPDFDISLAWIPSLVPSLYIFSHRGVIHSVFTLLIVFPIVVVILNRIFSFKKLEIFQKDLHIELTTKVYIIGVIGSYLHLFMDMLNPQGIMPFTPFYNVRFTFSTTNFIEPLVSIPAALILLAYFFVIYYKKQSINVHKFDYLTRAIGVVFIFFILLNTVLLSQTMQTQKTADTVPGLIFVYRWVILDSNNTYTVKLINQFTQQTDRVYTYSKLTFNKSELTTTNANFLINKAKNTILFQKFEYSKEPDAKFIINISKDKVVNQWKVSFTGIITQAQNKLYSLPNNSFLHNSVTIKVNLT